MQAKNKSYHALKQTVRFSCAPDVTLAGEDNQRTEKDDRGTEGPASETGQPAIFQSMN